MRRIKFPETLRYKRIPEYRSEDWKRKTGKYLDQIRTIEPEADGDTNNSWNPWINPKEPEKEVQGTGDPREDGNRLNHSTVEISEITEKSPGEPRSLDVIRTLLITSGEKISLILLQLQQLKLLVLMIIIVVIIIIIIIIIITRE